MFIISVNSPVALEYLGCNKGGNDKLNHPLVYHATCNKNKKLSQRGSSVFRGVAIGPWSPVANILFLLCRYVVS